MGVERAQHYSYLGPSWWPSLDAWPPQRGQTFLSAAGVSGGRGRSKTQLRRQQRQKALRKLKDLRDHAAIEAAGKEQENRLLGPPPGLEDVCCIPADEVTPHEPDTAAEAEQQELARARMQLSQLQEQVEAMEAMGKVAMDHALGEQEMRIKEYLCGIVVTQGMLSNARWAFDVDELEQNASDNPMDMVYDAVVAATKKEMCGNLPAWVPLAEAKTMAKMADADFDEAMNDWLKLDGMLVKTCVALQAFPQEWRVKV